MDKRHEALQYYQMAIEIQKSCLGYSHPDLANTFNCKAIALLKFGQKEDALKSFQQSLEIYQISRDETSNKGIVLLNIGLFYLKDGRKQDAQQNLERSTKILFDTVGYEHALYKTAKEALDKAKELWY